MNLLEVIAGKTQSQRHRLPYILRIFLRHCIRALLRHGVVLAAQALDDIEVAMKIIRRRASSENPLDANYKALDCQLQPLDHTNADFKVRTDRYFSVTCYWWVPPRVHTWCGYVALQQLQACAIRLQLVSNFMQTTHANTHNQYTMKILDVFDVSRGKEDANFKDYGNKCV